MRSAFLIIFFLIITGNLFAETNFDSKIDENNNLQYIKEKIVLNHQHIEGMQNSISAINEKISAFDFLINNQQNEIYNLSKSTEKNDKIFHENLIQFSKTLSLIASDLNTFKKDTVLFLEDLSTSLNKTELQSVHNYLANTEKIDELRHLLAENKKELSQRIENVDISASHNEVQLELLGHDLKSKAKHFSYLIFIAGLIGATGLVLGIVIHKKHANSKNLLEENILNVRRRVEEEYVTLDSRLIDLLQNQINFTEAALTTQNNDLRNSIPEPDHSFPLRVGEEIFRMRQRLNSLPNDTKGLKPLLKSLERLEDEFTEKGYEIVDMTNQPFSDGLNVKARFIPSEDLNPGEHIITKVVKPQINFNCILVQVAEVEVSTGGE